MAQPRPGFPRHGKIRGRFYVAWKNPGRFLRSMENFFAVFPRHGKTWAAAAGLACALAGCRSAGPPGLDVPKAKFWKVTASAAEAGHEARRAVDGKTNTYWRSGPQEPQWLQADLVQTGMVCGFSLQWGVPHATAYAVLTSRDGQEWATAYETTTGDGDWDQGALTPTEARFVRVEVNKGVQGTGAALCTLEIKGLETQPEIRVDGQPAPDTLALLDGNPATEWRCARDAAMLTLDLRGPKPVGSVRVDWGTNGFASNVVVETSTNGTDWTSAGLIQATEGNFDVLMRETAAETRYVRLAFSAASAPGGFGVAGIALRGPEGTAQPWAKYELAAEKAPPGAYPEVLRHGQPHWAVAGGPAKGDPECLLDEWGAFAPTPDGPTLAPLIVANGEVVSARQAAEREYRLGGDGAPMPETTWRLASGLSLRIRAMARAGSPATAWVEYELTNGSIMAQSGRLCWLIRPVCLPPPLADKRMARIFKIRAHEAPGGWQAVRINGRPAFAVPARRLPFGAAEFNAGDVVEAFLRGETPAARSAADVHGLASGAWWLDFALEPGEKKRLVVAANAEPRAILETLAFPWPAIKGGAEKVADAFEREWADAEWRWRDKTDRYAPKIARPDAIECLHAQTGWLLGVRTVAARGSGEDVDSIRLRTAALLRAGQTAAAREWVAQVVGAIQPNGRVPATYRANGAPALLPEPEDRPDAQGQFAFMAMEYYRFVQDAGFLQEIYPALRNALGYLHGLRTAAEQAEWKLPDEERVLVEGLLPPSAPRPGSPGRLHRYADNYWALLGWKEMLAAASILGRQEDADWASEQYRLLKSAVRRSLRERMDRMAAAWIPAAAEEERLDVDAVALLFWPCAETDVAEPHELQSSLDAWYEEFVRRRQPEWSGFVSSREAQLLVPLAAMGRGDYARETLYALLERRYPPGWHVWAGASANDPQQPGPIGDMPDIRAAAAYFIAVRGLALRETGNRLDLFSGAPAEWLQHGEGFRTFGAPTCFGPLDLSGYWHRNRFAIEIRGGARPPEGYRIWWPRQTAPERVLANGQPVKTFNAQWVELPDDFKGTVEVVFPFNAPWPREL